MKTKMFETALNSLIPEAQIETEMDRYLHQLASQVDEARYELAHMLRRGAEQLSVLADSWENGHNYGNNPLASSTLYELPVLMTRAREQEDAFWNTLRAYRSSSGVQQVKHALRGGWLSAP